MAIIAPAQSSLRVMPTAPAVDTGAFSQIPNPAAGMQMFEQAAKLPLLMEQIKMEQQKNKVETEKLKAAKLQAEYQVANFEKIAEQQQAMASLERQKILSDIATNEARAKAALAESSLVSLPGAATAGPLADASVAAPTAPFAGDKTGWSLMKQPGGYGTAPANVPAPAAPVPEVAPVPSIRVKAATKLASLAPALPQGADPYTAATAVAEQTADAQLRRQYGDKVPLKVYREQYIADRGKILERLQPKQETYSFEVDGMPMKVSALMVGSRPVSFNGEPFVDVKAVHERVPTQKVIDDEVAKDVGEWLTGKGDRAMQTNLSNLDYAKGILQNNGLATGAIVSLVPEWARRRIPGLKDGISARDAVRSVVQQTLRQTLGAQFARVEGELMMERAFDPTQDESENIRRVNLLIDESLRYAAVKAKTADYFREYGTMFGYQGESLEAAADAMAARFNQATAKAPSAEAPDPKVVQAEKARDLATGWAQRWGGNR